ncbi:MAG: hypothetical protein KJ941_04505 [Bacteroidetes bacterium]|nr:hypothetical protein [Bacteroidota bacterium]
MEGNRKTIVDLLTNKSKLKQDISDVTHAVFDKLKSIINAEITSMRPAIKDDRIRLNWEDKGDFEGKVMIGSDALYFQRHSNVFMLEPEHALMQDEIIQANPSKAYFGVINIYNFLADSVLFHRLNDSGFLIGRIFVNCDSEIFVEGKGQLDFLFKNPKDNPVTEETLKHIVQCAFTHALDFDLYCPPYEVLEEVSLQQILALSADNQLKTSKRLGFKQ